MRAPVDDDLPLPLAMTRLVNQVTEATGMNLHLDIEDNLPGLPFSHRHALFRAAQEGLTNIERHASATETWIRLYLEDDHIFATIADNGVGLDPDSEKSGLGLRGMQERATLLNGELKILPRLGGGTQLSFSLPVPRETSL
jgi:signal transduction histidine kinase